jgi:hypothetical protein
MTIPSVAECRIRRSAADLNLFKALTAEPPHTNPPNPLGKKGAEGIAGYEGVTPS